MNKYLEKAAEITIKKSRQGALHKDLGVPPGQHLSNRRLSLALSKAKKDGDTKLVRRIVFAQTARKWKHKKQ